MDALDIRSTALVLIDLQQGILRYAGGPHSAADVLSRSGALAQRFRALGAPVVLVRVGWSDDRGDLPAQPVDRAAPLPPELPADWWDIPAELAPAAGDLRIVKRHWNAFHGTELDLQLRRRGIRSVVLAGISTNIGVESTARMGWELGYAMVLAEDAMSGQSAENHRFAVEQIFPRLGRVRSTEQILAALNHATAAA
jgi:nicotinamidase-related amidase